MTAPRYKSRTIFMRKWRGHPFGIFTWSRNHYRLGGIVFRFGPLGHVQLQHYRGMLVGRHKEGRRGRHGVKLSWWGVSGRRRKKAVDISIHL